jgi:macrophage erythroblast attacher
MFEAIEYARTQLSPWAMHYLPELQQAAMALAFKADTACEPYCHLFSNQKWQDLIDLFHQELFRLNHLTPLSLLSIHLQVRVLYPMQPPCGFSPHNPACKPCFFASNFVPTPMQAGLSVLKTPLSFTDTCSQDDPLHLPAFRQLAADLPQAKHVHSKLICALTREVMDEHNVPMVLPNGYVYSERALQEMAAATGGRIICPKTGLVCEYNELRRAYVS